MKLSIYTTDGGCVTIADLDLTGVFDLRKEVEGDGWLLFTLDDGETIINPANIARIDIDDTPKPSWWRRLFAKEGDE